MIKRCSKNRSAQSIVELEQLECGPIPNVMAALSNKWRPLLNATVRLTPTARVSCNNAANIAERKIWTQSEFCTW